ncbi:MAG: TPR end-of-group domain-containing protein [Planctomycetota bacterium]|jgi:phospholipase/carboxylesterase
MHRWALSVLILALPLAAQEKVDIFKVKPEQLRGVDARKLVAEAHQAYNEKRYADAAGLYIMALQARQRDSNALYNLACCYGLLGHAEQAIAFLEESWNAGFRDLNHIRNDPDFDKVKGAEAFAALLEKMAEEDTGRKRAAGKRLLVAAPVVASVRVVEPEAMDPRVRYPVLIGLHGFGDSGESFAGLFVKRGIQQDFLFVAAEAPYALAIGDRVGYGWYLRSPEVDRPTSLHSQRLAMHYVMKVLEAVRQNYLIDERSIFLMGYSQGAGIASSVGMRQPQVFRGVIPIGGWFSPGEYTSTEVARAVGHGRFLVCHSPDDKVVPFKFASEAVKFLGEKGIAHRLIRYPGGHSLPKDLLTKIVTWMKDPTLNPAPEPEKR